MCSCSRGEPRRSLSRRLPSSGFKGTSFHYSEQRFRNENVKRKTRLFQSPTEFAMRFQFHDHRIARTDGRLRFVLRVFGIDSFPETRKLGRTNNARLTLNHNAAKKIP